MNDTVLTAIDAVQQLAAHAEQLERHVDILAKGTGAQAVTIRNLRTQAQDFQQQVMVEQYNGELYRAQGRKTRNKVRALKTRLKDAEAHASWCGENLSKVEVHADNLARTVEAQNVKLRNQQLEIATLKRHLHEAITGRELPAPTVIHHPEPHRVQFLKPSFGEQRMETAIAVNQLQLNTMVPDMLIADGGPALEEAVKLMVQKLTLSTEQFILDACDTRAGRPSKSHAQRRSEANQRRDAQRKAEVLGWYW